MNASKRKGPKTERGFTILELMLVIAVIMIGLLALSRSLVASMQLTNTNRETALATDAVQEMLEILQGAEDFSLVFALYNEYPDDDPGVPGSAPGNNFAVQGLDPDPDDPDGFVGEIIFPAEYGVADLELHEIILDPLLSDELSPLLGMPRDLDGSGDLDTVDHADDYQLLPVSVRVRWTGATGIRELEMQTLLADR